MASGTGVQQPKPQALPSRNTTSSILVSVRQKGNPVLNYIKALPWEYAETPADYVLGATTCALFLSLKYHRLHPEYIYSRIRQLAGKYNLRVVLAMVDIENHEEPLKELSKTSLINNVTIILCWSAQEAGRYLELFKSFENASSSSISAQKATTYSEQLTDFITTPRGINKTDALSLISNFGSVRTAVNARPDEVALVDGFGEKKIQRWCNTVREPFRVQKAARRGLSTENSRPSPVREDSRSEMRQETESESLDPAVAIRLGIAPPVKDSVAMSPGALSDQPLDAGPNEDEEAALLEAMGEANSKPSTEKSSKPDAKRTGEGLSEGVSAALARLRNQG